MCVTMKKTDLRGTTILVGQRGNLRYLHYRNTAGQDKPVFSGRRSMRTPMIDLEGQPARPSGWNFDKPTLAHLTNCMAFPIFGKFETIDSVETSKAPNFLDAIDEAVKSQYPVVKGVSFGRRSRGGDSNEVRIIVTDLYTTILARDPRVIPDVLNEHGAAADLYNPTIAKQFQEAYPGVAFGLNLFADNAAKQGGLLLTFEPLKEFEDIYFVPTTDGHGELDFSEDVKLDHIIAVGTDSENAVKVNYPQVKCHVDVSSCLPSHVLGVELRDIYLPNGDIIINKKKADQGIFEARRVAPFGLTGNASKLIKAPLPIAAPSARDY